MMLFQRRSYRNFKRFREIVRVFTKYGFASFFRRFPLLERFNFPPVRKDILNNPPQVNLRMALEELGTTFIKIGQILSMRIDILSEDYCRELKKLQDDTTIVDSDQIREIVETELQGKIEEVFQEFDQVPLASASIAQVHRAVLKDGQKVAVKIQKPDVEKKVDADLEILTYFSGLADRLMIIPESISLGELVAEFKKNLLRETDFLYEAMNALKFRENFSGVEGVYIPNIVRKFSTRRVLTMELIEGVRVTRLRECHLENIDCPLLAQRGAMAVLKMIFEDGFFHVDPHPGNLMVKETTGELVFLDFGMVGALDSETRESMVKLLIAALGKDASRVVTLLEEDILLTPVRSPVALRMDLNEILERYITADLKEMNFNNLVTDFFYILRKNNLRFPAHLASMMRALVVAEGTGMMLDPDFTIAPYLEKFLKRVFTRSMGVDHLTRKAINFALDWKKLVEEFPGKSHDILTKLSSGRFSFKFESKEMEELNRKLDTISNRISLSIILAALLIGSSLIYTNYQYLKSLSILGILGYIVAAFLGIMLVFEMLRHR
ncbi:MAG: AarF/ABC1/UbiB kinase family protein [Candidatus Atribacteria bacterium]|nr:AarF/ABC1/UbiB kinase family protein [Candidatus Atribacteria bacterium]